MNDFDEQPNKQEQDTFSSVTCRCLLAARAHDPWRKTDELFQISATYVFETLEVLSFMLLFKLKVHVTASFSADLRDMTLTSVNARLQELRHSCIAHRREAAAVAALRNVCAKNRPTGVNERSFVKKVRSWKSQTNNIRMFEHSLQL